MSVRITCGDCGYRTAACRSQKQADYAVRRHSCGRERARQASARRRRARVAAVDRTPQPCLHKLANHEHGTHACYVLDRCRCRPCATANSRYEADRAKRRAYGHQAYVDAQPTREHVLALRATGMGAKTIAKVSGVPHGSLAKLIYGDPKRNLAPSKRIRWETAVKLQVVRPVLAGGACVDPTGTRRRVQALVAIGWSQAKICSRLGVERGNWWRSMEVSGSVSARLAREVAALYDELWDTRPAELGHRDKIAASRARNYAKARGWLPPLAWDEETIDDPAAQPTDGATSPDPTLDDWDELDAHAVDDLDEVMVERIVAGHLNLPKYSRAPELVEAVAQLAGRGLSDAEIGERIGREPGTVQQIRARNCVTAPAAARGARKAIVVIADRSGASEDGRLGTPRRPPAA